MRSLSDDVVEQIKYLLLPHCRKRVKVFHEDTEDKVGEEAACLRGIIGIFTGKAEYQHHYDHADCAEKNF